MKPKLKIKRKKLIVVKRPDCCICLEKVGKANTKLECGHSFCSKCIFGWVLSDHSNCPICRAKIDMPENLSSRSVLEKKIEELEARVRIMNQMINRPIRRERVVDLTGGTDGLLALGSASEQLTEDQWNQFERTLNRFINRLSFEEMGTLGNQYTLVMDRLYNEQPDLLGSSRERRVSMGTWYRLLVQSGIIG